MLIYAQMVAVYRLLSAEVKVDLERWEKEMIGGDGKFATSDWPGWEKHIANVQNIRLFGSQRKSRFHPILDGRFGSATISLANIVVHVYF